MGQVKSKIQKKNKPEEENLSKGKSGTLNEDGQGDIKKQSFSFKAKSKQLGNVPSSKETSDLGVTKAPKLSASQSFGAKNILHKNSKIGIQKVETSPIAKKTETGIDNEHELKGDASKSPFQKMNNYTRSASKKGIGPLNDHPPNEKEHDSLSTPEQGDSLSRMASQGKKSRNSIHFQKKMNDNSDKLTIKVNKTNSFPAREGLTEGSSTLKKMDKSNIDQSKKQYDSKSLLVKKSYILPSTQQSFQKNKDIQKAETSKNATTTPPPADTVNTKKDTTIKSNESKTPVNKIVVPEKKKFNVSPKGLQDKKDNSSASASETSHVVNDKMTPLKHSKTPIKQSDATLKNKKKTSQTSLTSSNGNTVVSTRSGQNVSKQRDVLDTRWSKPIATKNSFDSRATTILRSASTKSALTDSGSGKLKNSGVRNFEKSFVVDSPTCASFHTSEKMSTSKSGSLEMSPRNLKTSGSGSLKKKLGSRKLQRTKTKTKNEKKGSVDESKEAEPLSFLERISCSCQLPEHARNKCVTCQRVTFDDCPLL